MSPDFRSEEDADERLWDCVSRLSRLIVAGRKKEMARQAGTVRACARGGDAGRKERGRNGLLLLSFTVGLLDDGCKDGLQFHHSNWMNYMCSS
jgi:hypothetical protein